MPAFPESFKDLLQKKAFAVLATVNADGAPQVTPVWFDFDGTHIRFNTARGRVKEKNLARNPKVALAIMDPDNPYRYVQVRGRIAEVTETGADAHIDALAKKYTGADVYGGHRPDQQRVIVRIAVDGVARMGY